MAVSPSGRQSGEFVRKCADLLRKLGCGRAGTG